MNARRLTFQKALPFIITFLVGLWLVVLRPLGLDLSRLPGDLGDGRFNNYVLEHFYRWLCGLEPDYWNAPFFAPYPNTIAFSDNLLGSAPFYALLRGLGLDRESAFQGWYLLSFALNYAAAAGVLARVKFKPVSAALGAFFFTFGLPVLAQEGHAQLAFRFAIPIAAYLLWKFFQQPRLSTLAGVAFWTAWQLYLSIYLGILLGMFLLALLAVLICLYPAGRRRGIAWSLPERLRQAWRAARPREKAAAFLLFGGAVLAAGLLMLPYFQVTRLYYFSRPWNEVTETLPRWQSYLLAQNSLVWEWVTRGGGFLKPYLTDFSLLNEHQLFPGFALVISLLAGPFLLKRNRRLVVAFLGAAMVLVIVTFYYNGFSLYRFIWSLPGMGSLRSLTRVQLVLMFPLSVYLAGVLDGLEKPPLFTPRWENAVLALFAVLLIGESALYTHSTISKAEAQARLTALRAQIPDSVPQDPVLLLVSRSDEPAYQSELDAMLLAQELGWKTMNGYSGNVPTGYRSAESCSQLTARIEGYMKFAGISDPEFERNFIRRVVPLGFSDCNLDEWLR